MVENLFNAVVVDKVANRVNFSIQKVSPAVLSTGDVLIKVHYSSVNYKDMLAVQAHGGVIKKYPMIPGIDLSGEVIMSGISGLEKGQSVVVTGFDLGMTHTGGFAEYARVPSEWIVPLPESLSTKQAMIIGTAGFTAGIAIQKLMDHGLSVDEQPRILVTGASGGVGSVALKLLNKIGYRNISALIRKKYQVPLVKSLGAKRIVTEEDIFMNDSLYKEKFDYVIDTVGGQVASAIISQIAYGGSMAFCGNAGGINLQTTVLPLILRGVNLLGIDSVKYPREKRTVIWQRFANQWAVTDELKYDQISLVNLATKIDQLKKGQHQGRTIIKLTN